MPTILETANQIKKDLDAWQSHMRAIGEHIPDFWDEQNASERIGEWLAACGYQKSGKSLIGRPGDIITVQRVEVLEHHLRAVLDVCAVENITGRGALDDAADILG